MTRWCEKLYTPIGLRVRGLWIKEDVLDECITQRPEIKRIAMARRRLGIPPLSDESNYTSDGKHQREKSPTL